MLRRAYRYTYPAYVHTEIRNSICLPPGGTCIIDFDAIWVPAYSDADKAAQILSTISSYYPPSLSVQYPLSNTHTHTHTE